MVEHTRTVYEIKLPAIFVEKSDDITVKEARLIERKQLFHDEVFQPRLGTRFHTGDALSPHLLKHIRVGGLQRADLPDMHAAVIGSS